MVLQNTALPLASASAGRLSPPPPRALSSPGQPDPLRPPETRLPPARRQHTQNDYAALMRSIQDRGLLERRYGYYAAKGAGLAFAASVVWVAFAFVGDSWMQLVVAAAFGLVLTHVAFLSHDAAHRQVFRSGRANEWLAILLGGLVMGMSAAWWQRKHTRHHANPNQIGKDPDIDPTVIVFYPQPGRHRGRMATFLTSRQGWWFFPILSVEGLNLHIQSLMTLLGRAPVKHRTVELAMISARWAAYLTVLFVVLSPGIAGAFLGVQLVTFGVYMGCTFAPSHKGMDIVPEGAKLDFFRRQVLTSRNITGPALMTFAMGGLNYQIEHHLFPSMPRGNLRKARAVIEPYCRQQGVPYTESSLLSAYVIVVRYLNRVGLGARDPFECPMVAGMRPRG
jgi:fatty acid desaturase